MSQAPAPTTPSSQAACCYCPPFSDFGSSSLKVIAQAILVFGVYFASRVFFEKIPFRPSTQPNLYIAAFCEKIYETLKILVYIFAFTSVCSALNESFEPKADSKGSIAPAPLSSARYEGLGCTGTN